MPVSCTKSTIVGFSWRKSHYATAEFPTIKRIPNLSPLTRKETTSFTFSLKHGKRSWKHLQTRLPLDKSRRRTEVSKGVCKKRSIQRLATKSVINEERSGKQVRKLPAFGAALRIFFLDKPSGRRSVDDPNTGNQKFTKTSPERGFFENSFRVDGPKNSSTTDGIDNSSAYVTNVPSARNNGLERPSTSDRIQSNGSRDESEASGEQSDFHSGGSDGEVAWEPNSNDSSVSNEGSNTNSEVRRLSNEGLSEFQNNDDATGSGKVEEESFPDRRTQQEWGPPQELGPQLDATQNEEALKKVGEWLQTEVRRARRAGALLVLAQVLFCLASMLTRTALSQVTAPTLLLCTAVALPVVSLLPALLSARSRRELSFGELQNCVWIPYMVLLGLTGVFASQFLLVRGLQVSVVSNLSLSGQLVPVYACAIAVLRLQEAPSKLKFTSITVSVVGAVVMAGLGHATLSLGSLWFVARALCFAAYLTMQASVLSHLSPPTISFISQASGALMLFVVNIPFFFEAGKIHMVPPESLPLIGGVVVCTSLGYLLTLAAARSVSPVVAAVYGNTHPIAACLFNAALLAEPLCPRELYGALVLLIGAFATVTIEDAEKRAPGGGAQLAAMECYLGSCGIVSYEDTCQNPKSPLSIRSWLRRVSWKVILWTIWWLLVSTVVALLAWR